MSSKKVDKIDMSLDDIIKLNRRKTNTLKRQPLQNKSNQKSFGANNRPRIQNKIKGFRSKFTKGKNALPVKKGTMPFNKLNNQIKKVPVRKTQTRNQQNNSTKTIVQLRQKNNRKNFQQRRSQQTSSLQETRLSLQTRSFQQRRLQQTNRFQQRRLQQTNRFQQRRLNLQTANSQRRLTLQTRNFQQRRLQQNNRVQQRRLQQSSRFQQQRLTLQTSSFQQRRLQQANGFQQRRLQAQQGIINKRRGIQTSKANSTGRSFGFMRSDLIVKSQDQQQKKQKRRRWRNNFQQTANDVSESHGLLTVSVPNNFVQKKQPRINRKFNYNNSKFSQQQVVVNKVSERNIDFDSESNTSLGQTSLSLHDRFSSSSITKRIVFM